MKTRIFVVVTFFCLCAFPAFGQKKSAANPAAKLNPETVKMLAEVSARNIEATIRKLVSFGTRNTLSEQDNPTRGVDRAPRHAGAESTQVVPV